VQSVQLALDATAEPDEYFPTPQLVHADATVTPAIEE
jgi:hypothetical protein